MQEAWADPHLERDEDGDSRFRFLARRGWAGSGSTVGIPWWCGCLSLAAAELRSSLALLKELNDLNARSRVPPWCISTWCTVIVEQSLMAGGVPHETFAAGGWGGVRGGRRERTDAGHGFRRTTLLSCRRLPMSAASSPSMRIFSGSIRLACDQHLRCPGRRRTDIRSSGRSCTTTARSSGPGVCRLRRRSAPRRPRRRCDRRLVSTCDGTPASTRVLTAAIERAAPDVNPFIWESMDSDGH